MSMGRESALHFHLDEGIRGAAEAWADGDEAVAQMHAQRAFEAFGALEDLAAEAEEPVAHPNCACYAEA